MAYIAPNSTIRFHQNIALDNTYDHTYYFDSLSAQNTFFSYVDANNPNNSRVKLTIDNMSYQRHTRDSIKVGVPIERIVNCNYMSFKNTSFENKWFYCFITDLEYVNNNTTIVYYEIDVMQTYVVNDITFDQCYIERQHTVSDNIGENTIPEDLEMGEYIYEDYGIYQLHSGYLIIIAATCIGTYDALEQKFNFTTTGGTVVAGNYSGVYLNIFDPDAVDGVFLANKFLEDITTDNKSEAVVSVFTIPKDFLYYNSTTQTYSVPNIPVTIDRYIIKHTTWTYNSHACRNNKLYTYPFSALYVDNGQGNSATYRWEFFSTATAKLKTYYIANISPEMVLIPCDYNGVSENKNERLIIDNFPLSAFAIDAYKAWLAQNETKLKLSIGSIMADQGMASKMTKLNFALGAVTAAGGALTGNPLAVIGGMGAMANVSLKGIRNRISAGFSVAQLLNEKTVASKMPPHVQGSQANSSLIPMNNLGFRCYSIHLRPEYAQIIDDYFTRYGYAIHQNAVPNLCARTRFTYIKTVDCTISGNLPNNYSQQIVDIMNSGITFWNDKTNVGNYELANNIIPG